MEKKEFLITLVPIGIGFILFCVVDRVRYAPSLTAFREILRSYGKGPCVILWKKKSLQDHHFLLLYQ